MTDHREFQFELAAYTASRLTEEQARSLEAHLRECDECRDMASRLKEFGETLEERGETLFEPHPSPALLGDFARSDSGKGREAIVRHLETCASCGLEVDAFRSGTVPGRTSIARIVWPLAAGLILGVGLATFARMAFQPRPEPGRVAAPTATAGPMLVLPPLLRGSRETVAYALDRNSGFVVVASPAKVPEDASPEQRFVYIIQEPGGKAVWSQAMSARSIREHLASAAGSVVLLVPAADLHSGRYEFTLAREGSREEPTYRVDVEMTGAR